jgi:hypothetical protein
MLQTADYRVQTACRSSHLTRFLIYDAWAIAPGTQCQRRRDGRPLMQAPAALGVGATRKTHCQWESPSCAAYRVALSNPRNSGRWRRLVCAVSRGLFLVHSLSRRGLYQYLHTSRRTRRRRVFTPSPVPPPQTPSAEKSSATDAYKLSGFLLEEPCHRCDPT